VYSSTTSGFTPSSSNLVASVSGTSYSNTGLSASTTHYYVVEAVDAEGSSVASSQVSAETSAASCSTVPAAPTGLTATASSSSAISLSWSAVSAPANCSISSYNVYGSTTSGFTPSAGTLIASSGTATSYSNTGLTASTAYYYVVEAADADGSSTASSQATATTQSGSATDIVAINAGGPAVSNSGGGDASFVADEDVTGGGTDTSANTIVTAGVTNAAPMAVYQTERAGTFTYTIPGLVAGSTHTVLLHFAEFYWTAADKRVFNVAINGTTSISTLPQERTRHWLNSSPLPRTAVGRSLSHTPTVPLTNQKPAESKSNKQLADRRHRRRSARDALIVQEYSSPTDLPHTLVRSLT
jgi:hypothetical protein